MEDTMYIVAGGPSEFIPDLKERAGAGICWTGVDRGVYRLLRAGIVPDYAFGDFDSVDEEEWAWIEKQAIGSMHRFPPEKNDTDLELAVRFAANHTKIRKIEIFGATGGRLDHFFGNAFMLFKYVRQGLSLRIIDKQNMMTVYLPGQYTVSRMKEMKYISFIPLQHTVTGLTLDGFKYPLRNRDIPFGSSLCISNELIQSAGTFSFSGGILMMIRSND